MRFGDFLAERTPLQFISERIFPVSLVGVESFGAGVFVPRMAENAIVDLALHLPQAKAIVGKLEPVPAPEV
jgi:uncharacterized protein YqcC (DUF446 family)